MKGLLIFFSIFIFAVGCVSCNKEVKGLREEIRLLKEENNFLKAENIGLKKEIEELYKKLDEKIDAAAREGLKQKAEPKESSKPRDNSKVEEPVKKKR